MNKDLYFECIEEFADYVIDRVEYDEELFVTVIGKFETIKPLLKEFMTYEPVKFDNIELESEFVTGYKDEFVLSLWMNDNILEFGCEKLKRDGEYMMSCGDETYLFEDCSSKIISLCEGSDLYFVNFDDECDCDEDCCGRCSCDCHCSDIEATNTEKYSYKINGIPVSRQEFDKKYEELHEKYGKNVRSILDDYYDFIDYFNNFFTLI